MAPLTKPRAKASSLTFLRCLLWLVPIYSVLPYFFAKLHYRLPTPVNVLNAADGTPIVSEGNILAHIAALEEIGFRIVGTEEAVKGEEYVIDEVVKLKERCDEGGIIKCDMWIQIGDGVHQFDIMEHPVLKSYQGIQNIILRFSPTTKPAAAMEIKQDAVLLNAHIDSALPSKGSADDAIGVAVMLDVARVIIDRNEPIFASAIFLFNGAEETLQDASHMYSTQHETRDSVRAVINLEAAGATGGALLFQATSKEMIEAYSHAPWPHGTVIAADVFASGVLMSDTDFVQFQKYLGVSGLDMATVGHSYYYHTRKDLLENIQAGSAQHFAENIIGILDHLLGPDTPLLSIEEWSEPDMAYAGMFDLTFIRYSMRSANKAYSIIASTLVAVVIGRARLDKAHIYGLALGAAFVSMIASMVGAVAVAFVMYDFLGRGQSWFRHEHSALVLFGPPALLSSLMWQYTVSSFVSTDSRRVLEHASLYGQVGMYVIFMALMQFFQIRSAYLFAGLSTTGLLGIYGSEAMALLNGRPRTTVDFPFAYMLLGAANVILGVEAVTSILDIFVPLTGRMGREAPTEIIIAILSSMLVFLFTPTTVPFFHRFSRIIQRRILLALLVLSGTMMAVFAARNAYDAEHPKRLGVQYVHNVTSGDNHLHIAQMDRGPGFQDILQRLHDRYGLPHHPITPNPRSEENSDWDVLYPISAFLETEMFELGVSELNPGFKLPEMKIKLESQEWDEAAGARSLGLKVEHTGLVYPVIAFSGEVSTWSFNAPPPAGRQRHYIKAAAPPGSEEFTVDIKLKMDNNETVAFSWVGIDRHQLFPSTSERLGADLPSTSMFVDMDKWFVEEWNDSLEVLMIGVIAGALEL